MSSSQKQSSRTSTFSNTRSVVRSHSSASQSNSITPKGNKKRNVNQNFNVTPTLPEKNLNVARNNSNGNGDKDYVNNTQSFSYNNCEADPNDQDDDDDDDDDVECNENSKRDSNSFHNENDPGKRARKNNFMVPVETLHDATNRIVQTDSYETSGVSGSSTVSSDAEVYHRMRALEMKISLLESKLQRNLVPIDSSIQNRIILDKNSNGVIGGIVRDQMFKAIKFLDSPTETAQGSKIFRKCLQHLSINGQEDNQQLYIDIVKRARFFLNRYKCHVKREIRKTAYSKFVLLSVFLTAIFVLF
jgi:hypothetical protein